MATNAWSNVDLIAAEALSAMMDALVIIPRASRDKTADFNTTPNGYKVGDTVRIMTEPAYEAQEFTTSIVTQGVRSSTRSMVIEKLMDVSVNVTAREKTMNLTDFTSQVIRPAAIALAEKADRYVGTKILNGQGLYVSATLLESAADVALARKASNYQQLNPDGRFALVNDILEATLLGQTWFNQSQTRGDPGITTLQSGVMGRVMGIDWYGSLNFPTPASAFTAGTMVCVTNNTTGTKNLIGDTTLTVDGQTASKTLVAGDRIQIAGVRRPLIVKTAIADTSATTAVALAHPITEIIPDDAAVTVIGTTTPYLVSGAIFDSAALGVAMPMLDPPSDKPSFVISYEGVSIRIVQGYDMATKSETMSMDFLIGAEAYDPRRITLLASA